MKAPETKELLKPPFSAYDFFGYLIPAILFLVCVFLFELAAKQFIKDYHQPLHSVVLQTMPPKDAAIYVQAAFIIGFILAVYVCGHIIGTISSVLLDRTLVCKAHGYPTEHLLFERDTSPRAEACRRFYRGFFAWTNILGWIFILWTIYANRPVPVWFRWVCVIFTLAPLSLYLVLTYFWPTPTEARRKRGHSHFDWKWYVRPFNATLNFLNRNRIKIRQALRAYSVPYDLGWWLLTRFFNWSDPFPAAFKVQYQNAFRKIFSMPASSAGTDNYWLSTFYVADRSPTIYQMIRNWFHLYSFARNVATAFYLAFCYGATYLAVVHIKGASIPPAAETCFIGTLAAYFALAVLMMIRYYYLYFSYYSKNLYRSFIYVNLVDSDSSSANENASESP